METFATPYPVIFHDGERDHDKGQIGVHSVLTFKRFQALLSHKIGFPASQLSAVFVCRRTAKENKRQKLPINDNTNFNIILNQHNPIWEKDCHFLVSMKKSKKERKGTRRRNIDAETGEEDGSVSPRGDLSPQEERPKCDGSADDEPAQEALVMRAPVLPVASSSEGLVTITPEPHRLLTEKSPQHVNLPNQRLINASSNGGRPNGEKILLRREQNIPGSLSSSWQNRSQVDLVSTSMPQGSPAHQADMRHGDKAFGQGELGEGRQMQRSNHTLVLGQPSHQQAVVSPTTEGFQERYHDVVAARSAVLLQRNGKFNLSGGTSIPPFTPSPAARPLTYPPTGGMLLSRVPNGLTSGTTAALQQAQAHYLNLQAQHSDQMQLNPQALSKMRGVVRNLAACENESHRPSGVCQHCCTFRERNINPTPFHLCVHDRVTNGFRGPSPAGPIERPAKRVEAAA